MSATEANVGKPANAVLIVEDYEDDAKLLELLLTGAGVINPLRSVLSAEQAIAYLEGAPPYWHREKYPLPAVIFVDLKLPGIDGFDFLRWLRAHPLLKTAFFVVLSATGDLVSVQAAYALGANSFLVKPCRAADLENLIVCYPALWMRSISPSALPSPENGSHPASGG
jgi:CheY-like chemotaxis protein